VPGEGLALEFALDFNGQVQALDHGQVSDAQHDVSQLFTLK